MSDPGQEPLSTWALAEWAARLFAVEPAGTGICIRARPGPQRENWLALMRRLLADRPIRKIPTSITDDRLLGGLDLTATLAAGRPVAERGVLADADCGAILLPSAERLPPALAARIVSVHDIGEIRLERDGLMQRSPARFGMILLDEGLDDDERSPAALMERIAFRLDLSGISLNSMGKEAATSPDNIAAARLRLPDVMAGNDAVHALCAASAALGIGSARAPLLALRVARIAAALAGRLQVAETDLALAGQLVLAWRAQAVPQIEPEDETDDAPEPNADDPPDEQPGNGALDDVVLAATRAALPPDLLAKLTADRVAGPRAGPSGQAGAKQNAARRGNAGMSAAQAARIQIRSSDFRIIRLAHRTETLTIFAVDASGSLALHRMAEAKGAVEMLLADCYVRRDRVALLAFRGRGAEILLPPTRSLVRAKRRLSSLPGGGGTPLASGIDAAAVLAQSALRRGQTPLIVLVTDGRANIARDGQPGRPLAHTDAIASANVVRRIGLRSLLIDTAPQPEERAEQLAAALGATYLALPRMDAGVLSAAVKGAQAGVSRRG